MGGLENKREGEEGGRKRKELGVEGGKRKYLSAGCFRANLRLRETDLQRRALLAYNKELVFAHRTENVGALRLDFYKYSKVKWRV